MADESTEVQADNTSKFGNFKLIIAGVVIIILAAGISFSVAMFAAKSVSGNGSANLETAKNKSATIAAVIDTGEFVTNLQSQSSNKYIKVRIMLALPEAEMEEEVSNKLPQIQHTINSILRQQTPESLSEQGGMEKLSEKLEKSINELLVKGKISDVYFTSFVVQ